MRQVIHLLELVIEYNQPAHGSMNDIMPPWMEKYDEVCSWMNNRSWNITKQHPHIYSSKCSLCQLIKMRPMPSHPPGDAYLALVCAWFLQRMWSHIWATPHKLVNEDSQSYFREWIYAATSSLCVITLSVWVWIRVILRVCVKIGGDNLKCVCIAFERERERCVLHFGCWRLTRNTSCCWHWTGMSSSPAPRSLSLTGSTRWVSISISISSPFSILQATITGSSARSYFGWRLQFLITLHVAIHFVNLHREVCTCMQYVCWDG